MKISAIRILKSHSDRLSQYIFRPNELTQFLSTHRDEWGLSNIAVGDILEALIKQKLIVRAEFTSSRYDSIIRYIRGEHSVEELALSLQHDSFLSHGTALALHGIAPPGKVIYVNREQSPKNPPSEITQAGIKLAFRNKQRESRYVLSYLKMKYVLLNGKHTNRAGVIPTKVSGRQLDVTDIERTLIDVVVRPGYAGGIENVANAYVKLRTKSTSTTCLILYEVSIISTHTTNQLVSCLNVRDKIPRTATNCRH